MAPKTPLPWTPATILHLAFAGDVEFAVYAANHHADLLAALERITDLVGDPINKLAEAKVIARAAIEAATQ